MGGRLITPRSANNLTDLADGAVAVRAHGRQARQNNTRNGASVPRVQQMQLAKIDDVERVSKVASQISKRFISNLQIISPSGMSHLPLCSARPHGNR